MIPEVRKTAKSLTTLAVVIGIIVFAVFSAQNNTLRKPNRTEPKINIASQNQEVREQRDSAVEVKVDSIQPTRKKVTVKQRPSGEFVYKVKSGDNLYDLARSYGISVDALIDVNNLESDKLQIDQQLIIPEAGKINQVKSMKAVVAVRQQPQLELTPNHEAPVKRRKVVRVASRSKGRLVGEPIEWATAAKLFPIGGTATVTDIESGRSFRIKRKGGHNHADNEPLTAEDSAIMKEIYGGSWSWARRAIVLTVGDKKIAASMAGMPHGSETISDNDFSGHFDIHFKGSMTHGSEYTKTRRPMVDDQHQAMVRKAAGL